MLTRNRAALAIALFALGPFSAAAATSVASSTATSSVPTITALQTLITELEAEFSTLVGAKGTSVAPASDATTAHVTFTHVLSLGSKGADVTALQQILKTAGFYTYPTITGYFGTLTEQALAAYQTAHGLDPVGYTGPKTRALLNGVVGAVGTGGATQPAETSPNTSSPAANATSSSSGTLPLFPVTPGYGGGGGSVSNISSGGGSSPAPDTTPPTVSLTAPTASSTVSGASVTLTATASDNVAVAGVQFKVDGANIGSAVSASPYATTWNSTGVVDGSHTLSAVAEDTSGNYATSSIAITVRNSPPVISMIASTSTNLTVATTTWTTDEPANSQIQYGMTTAYGSLSTLNGSLVTAHTVVLSGLAANTRYHYRILATDGQGNQATSSDQTFITAYIGVVATRGQVSFAYNSGVQSLNARKHYVARQTLTSAQLLFGNWWVQDSPSYAEQTPTSPERISASIEYPSGTFTQVTFGGATSTVVSGGANVLSDPTTVAIPNGASFWVRTYVVNTTGANGFLAMNSEDTAGGDLYFQSVGLSGDKTMGGTISNNIVAENYGPIAVVATTTQSSVLIVGDSRDIGTADTYDSSGDIGQTARSIGAQLGYINVSGVGHSLASYAASGTMRSALAKYTSHILLPMGINDTIASTSNAQMQTLTASVLALFPAGEPVWTETMPPYTSSTDNWETTANQTVAGHNSIRVANNDWRRTVPSGFAGVFDIASADETATDSGIWVVNGTPNYATQDGLHQTQAGNLLIESSAAINPALLSR